MEAPLPTGAQEGRGWTPFLPDRPDLSDEMRFARRVFPLPDDTAADFIKRLGLIERWHGGEHTVYMAESDPRHVFKISINGTGGDFVLMSSTKGDRLGLRRATLRAYVKRLKLVNENFGDDMKVLGVVFDKEAWQTKIVHQQRYRGEQESTYDEIADSMKKLGFQKIADDNITNQALAKGTFYHKKNNILVGDCHPRNFRTIDGEATPIDVVITQPEGPMREFALANVENHRQVNEYDRRWIAVEVDEFTNNMVSLRRRGGSPEEAHKVVDAMEGADRTKILLRHFAGKFMRDDCDRELLRVEAERHFRDVLISNSLGTKSQSKDTGHGHA
jgi:hypothetical protein